MVNTVARTQNFLTKSRFWVFVTKFFSNHFTAILEYGLIVALWYFAFGRIWNAEFIPMGGEYSRSMSPFFFWDNLKQCGGCAFWFPHGGGKPILADVFGSFLHPASMLFGLLYGAVAGASYTESFAFLLMGVSALWLGRMVDLTRSVRIWFATASMIGGHIVCRLELGSIGMPLSLASLFFALVTIYFYFTAPSIRRAILVGIATGSLFTAGQMYYQYFFVVIVVIGLRYSRRNGLMRQTSEVYRHMVLAGCIATLFAAPIVINMLVNQGLFDKETDTDVKFTIPIQTQIINFLIPNDAVARTELLNPFPYPWAYATYIGVLPLVAALGWFSSIFNETHKRLAHIALVMGAFAMVTATGIFTRLALSLDNSLVNFLASSFRFVVIYNGIAGIAILLIAALSVDAFLRSSGDKSSLIDRAILVIQQKLNVNIRSTIILLCLIGNVLSLQDNMTHYVHDVPVLDNSAKIMLTDLQRYGSGNIDAPDWIFIKMMQNGLMSASYYSSVILKGRDFPPPQYMLTQIVPDTIPTTILKTYSEDWKLVKNEAPDQQFASLLSNVDQYTLCTPAGEGGHITVACDAESSGTIRVLANAVPGWEYSLNGNDYVAASVGQWLSVDVPAGKNTVVFRYEPWYAWVALLLIPLTWILVLTLLVQSFWRGSPQATHPTSPSQPSSAS